MTPEEKAKELIEKFKPLAFGVTEDLYTKNAKACAIMCVDEIISELEEVYQQLSHNVYSKEIIGEHGNYWQQVKQSIINQ